MYRIIAFIRSITLLLLFLTLEGVAIWFYASSTSFREAKILGTSYAANARIQEAWTATARLLTMGRENRALIERIAELEHENRLYKEAVSDSLLRQMSFTDSELGNEYIAARIVGGTLNKRRNYMLLNRGIADGIRSNMAVITPNREMVGYIVECNYNYSVVMSVYNTNFHSSAKLKSDSNAGGITWDGVDRYALTMSDLSKYANIFEGAEVTTTGFSQIFPSDILIGKVTEFKLNDTRSSYIARVELSANLYSIDHVLVINTIQHIQGRDILEYVIDPKSRPTEVLNNENLERTLEPQF